jgi:hypothetical protein
MGASPSGASTEPRAVDAASQGASAPQNDYVRQLRDTTISRLTGTGGIRMAGDKLSEIQPTTSMAEESAYMKYSPEKTTKAPGSQYLAYSSSPSRLAGR